MATSRAERQRTSFERRVATDNRSLTEGARQCALRPEARGMFARALGAYRRRAGLACAFASALTLALTAAGCGGGASGDRQDKDEPSGKFPVEVKVAKFSVDQKLAESSMMRIVVRNAGNAVIPNIAVTVMCQNSKDGQNGSFDRQITGTDIADKNRPNFVVDRIPGPDRPIGNEQLDPLERSSAYVNTYTLGKLAPNQDAVFDWVVTAVHAGPFRVCYRVATGLDGKAIATRQGGLPLEHEWDGEISNVAPQTGVADDGHTVTTTPSDSGQ
jgi:hypothetical protein